MQNQLERTTLNAVAQQSTPEEIHKFRMSMQGFTEKLNALPTSDSVDKTPDGKAGTILISHIEMLLDEYFFGMWETENFKWAVIANEVVGSIDLVMMHPVSGLRFKRVGAAAIQIMVDKRPDNIPAGQWANDPANKKANALDMGFPKLKTECLKNAANSLGKLFGRDLNRKKSDVYTPLAKPKKEDKELERMTHLINDCTTIEQLEAYQPNVPEQLFDLYSEKLLLLKPKA